MSIIQKVLLIVTIIGGINWLLIGIFDFNLVYWLLMENSVASRVVYSIVGLCALGNIILLFLRNDHHLDDL
jgi:uncharacterized membrane protein YuzA (DUF378 family)